MDDMKDATETYRGYTIEVRRGSKPIKIQGYAASTGSVATGPLYIDGRPSNNIVAVEDKTADIIAKAKIWIDNREDK